MAKLSTEDALAPLPQLVRAQTTPCSSSAGDVTTAQVKSLAEQYYGRDPVAPPCRARPSGRAAACRLGATGAAQPARSPRRTGRAPYLAPSYTGGETKHVLRARGTGPDRRQRRDLAAQPRPRHRPESCPRRPAPSTIPVALDLATFGFYAVPRGDRPVADVEKAVEDRDPDADHQGRDQRGGRARQDPHDRRGGLRARQPERPGQHLRRGARHPAAPSPMSRRGPPASPRSPSTRSTTRRAMSSATRPR